MAQYENKGDRQNILLADELPEDMTGTQDTQHICGKCAWYSFRKLESICRKMDKEVAYFATKECFTTDKDMDMEENNNAQPVAESTGAQVCKECGRTLPLDEFQRRRNGNVDNVCKACRAKKARIGIERKKAVKPELPLMGGDTDTYFDDLRITTKPLTSREWFDEGIKYAQRLQKEQKPSSQFRSGDWVVSDAALLEELRRRGYKGTITKVQEVEI